MDFCETTSNTIIKTFAKFHFVMNLFQVIMTVDLTKCVNDIICLALCDVIILKLTLSFLTKTSRQRRKYLQNEKSIK